MHCRSPHCSLRLGLGQQVVRSKCFDLGLFRSALDGEVQWHIQLTQAAWSWLGQDMYIEMKWQPRKLKRSLEMQMFSLEVQIPAAVNIVGRASVRIAIVCCRKELVCTCRQTSLGSIVRE